VQDLRGRESRADKIRRVRDQEARAKEREERDRERLERLENIVYAQHEKLDRLEDLVYRVIHRDRVDERDSPYNGSKKAESINTDSQVTLQNLLPQHTRNLNTEYPNPST
jgi:hypothetical protein